MPDTNTSKPQRPPHHPPSPGPSSPRSANYVPLLSLAPPALALGDRLKLGEPGDDANVGEIWNVITRAADLVKDGPRLENLAWRNWGQSRREVGLRRLSISSAGSASTTELYTPATEHSSYTLCRSKSFEKRSFGASLKLLLEDDSNFRDWVEDAKKTLPPIISLPDTPVANLEIRLVEPTPVPSRVGSLGGSSVMGGLLSAAAVPPKLNEEEEEEEEVIDEQEPITIRSKGKKGGKFFLHSSPTKGSGSDSATSPVAAEPPTKSAPVKRPHRRSSASNPSPKSAESRHHRKSSGSSERPKKGRVSSVQEAEKPPKRNLSLSTMKGKFRAENRRAAAELASKDNSEGSGWEDDNEGWEEGEAEEGEGEGEGEERSELPAKAERAESQAGSEPGKANSDGDWSDEEPSPEKARPSRSAPNLDLEPLLRTNSRKAPHKGSGPPPPAPTPLRQMSKKERLAAKAERQRIEAELEAQQKREMFAKQQIFGKPAGIASGLLTGMFKTGGSMVDLTQAVQSSGLRISPTHGNLPSLSQPSAPGPNLLRSKSAAAVPVQTGVSVTVSPHSFLENVPAKKRSDSKSSKGSQERRPPGNVEFDTDDESGEEDTTLATSSQQRKFAQLVAKQEAKEESKSQPMPTVRFDEEGIAQPASPTTQRRNIIIREMSVSLRKSLIQDRKNSNGPIGRPTNVGPSRPPVTTRESNHRLERQNSEPSIHAMGQQPSAPRRSNVLGSGFLRPLTRVPTQPEALIRAQSSANLSSSNSPREVEQSQPMARSSTEDGAAGRHAAGRHAQSEYARRHPDLHQNWRAHGW